MQHEITRPQRLLDDTGNIAEPGFAKKLYWQYSRADIKAPAMRIKEWDYYYVGTQDYGICLTVSDAAYVSCVSASILRYGKKPKQMNDSEIGAFPMGKLHMPLSSKIGDVHAKVGTAEMTFENDGKTRHLFGTHEKAA